MKGKKRLQTIPTTYKIGLVGKEGEKDLSEASGNSVGEQRYIPPVSQRKDSLSTETLVTPRMRAEQIVVSNLELADSAVSYILQLRNPEAMATAVTAKVQASLAQYLIECAQNISAADSGKRIPQLPTAAANSGALQLMLAQRLAAKRNESRVVHRRVVEAVETVQPIAAEADGVISKP